jgi:hypothetical protein
MSCRRGAPVWVLSFVQERSSGAGTGDSLRRTALVLCDGCRRNSAAIADQYAAAGWQLQRTAPVLRIRDGSVRGRTAAAAVSAAAPVGAGRPRRWWEVLFGRSRPRRR